jgi:selenocysteine lyase/cysteine desulfurase
VFLMPPELGVMNAANLCPSPAPVLEAMYRSTRDMDGDPSFENRQKMSTGKEAARQLLARFLRVTPEEVVLTRNTSEANNMVSSGLDLKAGDEVVIFADNHPSNHAAWVQKAKRFGYTVSVIGSRTLILAPTTTSRPPPKRSRREPVCWPSRIRRAPLATCCPSRTCAASRVNAAC